LVRQNQGASSLSVAQLNAWKKRYVAALEAVLLNGESASFFANLGLDAEAPSQQASSQAAPSPSWQGSPAAQTTPAVRPSNVQIHRPSAHAAANRRRALVIGNARYAEVPVLDNSAHDAKAVAASLKRLGYEVSDHYDLNQRSFNRAIREFAISLRGGEEVVFYFAGHGVQLGSSNFLLPTDVGSNSPEQVRDESVDLQTVLSQFSASRAKFTLAMVDACRDNPFQTHGRSIGGRGLAPTSAATGQMILFSAGAGQQALDKLGPNDKERNGVFTRVLLKEMAVPGITVDHMLRRVRQEVVRLAQSVGHEQVPALYDQTIGEFYLSPP